MERPGNHDQEITIRKSRFALPLTRKSWRASFTRRVGPRPSFHRSVKHLGHVFPIDQMIHEGLEIIGPTVAVIDVIGMFPDIAAKDRLAAVHERILAVRSLAHGDLAVLDSQPAPAGPELCDAGLNEFFLHLGDRPEVGDDFLFKIAWNLVTAPIRLHPLPEMNVVVVLAGIVEES